MNCRCTNVPRWYPQVCGTAPPGQLASPDARSFPPQKPYYILPESVCRHGNDGNTFALGCEELRILTVVRLLRNPQGSLQRLL